MLKLMRYLLKIRTHCFYHWYRIFKDRSALPEDAMTPILPSELAFILGALRSGTTLLVRLINNCKEMHATSEMFFYYPHLFSEKKDLTSTRNLLSLLYELNQFSDLKKDRWGLVNTILTEKTDPKKFYGLLNRRYRAKIIDKVPDYAWYPKFFEELKRSNNRIGLIYIYRHPCAIANSFAKSIALEQKFNRKKKEGFKRYLGDYYQAPNFDLKLDRLDTVLDWCNFCWALTNHNILHYLKTNPEANYVLVPYEDLLTRPDFYYQAICDLFNIDYRECYLNLSNYYHSLPKWMLVKKLWRFDMPMGDPNQFDKKNSVIDGSRATNYRRYGKYWDKSDDQTKAIAAKLGYTKSSHDPRMLSERLSILRAAS